MLGKLSIIGAVLMIPTALSAQMGGAINPGVRPDFGTWRSPSGQVHRSLKHSKAVTKQRR